MKNKKIRIQFIIITLFWGLLSCEEDGDRVEYNNDVGIEVYLQNDDNWDSGIEVLRNVDGGMDGIETSGPVFLKIDQNNLFCLFQVLSLPSIVSTVIVDGNAEIVSVGHVAGLNKIGRDNFLGGINNGDIPSEGWSKQDSIKARYGYIIRGRAAGDTVYRYARVFVKDVSTDVDGGIEGATIHYQPDWR